MTNKKNNRYKIQLQELELKSGEPANKTLEFEFENHDDLFELIERTKANRHFEGENENLEFIVGLKLFSEVMIRNRTNPLFEELLPAFKSFMMKMKGK